MEKSHEGEETHNLQKAYNVGDVKVYVFIADPKRNL